jgi:alpha-1,6-mannosyltransferase
MNDLPRSRTVWAWAALGLAGSLLVAFAAPRAVGDAVVGWWYLPGVPAGRSVSIALLYIGMAALCVAWLGLGLGRQLPAPGRLLIVGTLWLLPLALAPPLFSRDVYSYLAQGTILHLGANPYHSTPSDLARLGRPHVLAAVSPFWRRTTAPYGPLFLELISLIVGITGSDLIAGVLLTRLLELGGIVLLAVFLPRLARALGTDARRAVWLALLSPLVALELVAAGHNDVLMIGMLLAGVVLALEGRPLLGIAVCALAATIKLPALAGTVFIAVSWARAEDSRTAQLRFLLAGALVAVGVLAVVTAAGGLGVSWISTSLFSTPAKVRLAITPATGVGWTLAALLRDGGVATSSRGLESALGVVTFALTAVVGLVLVHRVRIGTVALYLGTFLLVAAAGGPAAWPWYFTWGLVLIAGCRGPQRSIALAAAVALAVFLVKPNGILALPLQTAPAVVVFYALVGGAAWYSWRRRGGDRGAAGRSASLADGAPSALART